MRCHTFVENDHEMITTVILLPFADSFKKGCCQLQAKVCAQSNRLFKLAQEKSVVRRTDHPDMSIAVYWDVKRQTSLYNGQYHPFCFYLYGSTSGGRRISGKGVHTYFISFQEIEIIGSH